jgi:hypothetical protein
MVVFPENGIWLKLSYRLIKVIFCCISKLSTLMPCIHAMHGFAVHTHAMHANALHAHALKTNFKKDHVVYALCRALPWCA